MKMYAEKQEEYMKQRLMTVILLLAIAFTTTLSIGVPVYAAPSDDACAGITAAGGTCDKTAGQAAPTTLITTIIEMLTLVGGAVAVIMIIVGGIRYILANGDSNAVSSAKNTLMYAIIGLVIVVMARVIVEFVFTAASNV